MKAYSRIRLVLHSEPQELGSFTVDGNGNLVAQVFLPASVHAGYHTLHAYGLNILNEPVDLFKGVYVPDDSSFLTVGLTMPASTVSVPTQALNNRRSELDGGKFPWLPPSRGLIKAVHKVQAAQHNATPSKPKPTDGGLLLMIGGLGGTILVLLALLIRRQARQGVD